MQNKLIPDEIIEKMLKDKKIRTNIVRDSFSLFFHFYFSHYIKYETADFQKEIMDILEKNKQNLYIVSFRNSGKSTIVTTAFPIWATLGKLQKRFVLIICQTEEQAKIHMSSLKQELENNEILAKDLGPFKEDGNTWNIKTLKFTKNGSRIMFASIDQKIRGIRNNQTRPDIVILDDIEDLASTRTKEGRDKTYNWFKSELVPIGDRDTRIIAVGNLLHDDSLMRRIEIEIEEKKIKGVFKRIPIIETDNKINWIGKYKNINDINLEKENIGNEIFWRREYLLEIISEQDPVIYKSWIQRYAQIPERIHSIRIGVDPATSVEQHSDYTAIVTMLMVSGEDGYTGHILPNPINQKMTMPDVIKKCKELNQFCIKTFCVNPNFFIESVGMQKGLSQILNVEGLNSNEINISGQKIDRLSLAGVQVNKGKVLFPHEGTKELENQIINFGIEKHDDLADAFSLVCNTLSSRPIYYVGF